MLLTLECFGPVQSKLNPQFKLHELCTAWPVASDEDLSDMEATTRQIGGVFNNPGTVWNGLLIDGRNRQITCAALGMPFEYREFFGTYEQARFFVISQNMARRHLTTGQKAVQYVRIAEVDSHNDYGEKPTAHQVAKAVKTSITTARKAIELVSTGDEDAINSVMAGKSNIKNELKRLKDKARIKTVDLTGVIERPNTRIVDHTEAFYTDMAGMQVPKRMEDVWGMTGQWASLKAAVENIIPLVKKTAKAPGGAGLSLEHVRHLKDLATALDQRRPAWVCPHCLGKLRCDCEQCNKRWATRGKEEMLDCYCCQGRGFLMKEDGYPDPDWTKPAACNREQPR